ncbi:PIG-L family deacetylase [Streptomyces sp. SID8111]|uniref:PIG-L deacetylase family protein n=1 Tax=Streptomyces sp. SID8111 TaxID=2706100 RepID=UPI0013C01E5F|nr:PIG-L deacetylase family protein [Streptomyces sp. SID8111]NEC28114.1 PIG-L family deacetylase [Streptomyces sp. SID8111]
MSENLERMPEDWENALVLAAHPDDVEFGSAGAVAVWTRKGHAVSYLLATRGEAGIDGVPPADAALVREAEQHEAADRVGVRDVEFLDHPDGSVRADDRLRADLVAALRRRRPQLVVVFNHHERTGTGRWNAPDHREFGRCALDAVADAGNRWILPEAGAPWSVKYLAVANSPAPTHAVDISTGLDAAVASLEAHKTYLEGLGYTREAVRPAVAGQAQATGARFGGVPAVAFELIPC